MDQINVCQSICCLTLKLLLFQEYHCYIVCLTHSYKSTILDRFHTKYNLPVYLLLKKIQYYSTLAHRIRKKQPELGYTCI